MSLRNSNIRASGASHSHPSLVASLRTVYVVAMDLANTLIRTVARTFYETRHILVIDALFMHSVYVSRIASQELMR